MPGSWVPKLSFVQAGNCFKFPSLNIILQGVLLPNIAAISNSTSCSSFNSDYNFSIPLLVSNRNFTTTAVKMNVET